MIWNDILIDRNLSNERVVAACSEVFSVSPAEVLVVDDIAQAEVSEHIRLLCERMPVQGDFSMKLSIYVRDSQLEQLDPKLIIKQFCCILHCKCLISDSSVNPYSMLLVQESEDIEPVALDPERLDENEEYILTKIMGLKPRPSRANCGIIDNVPGRISASTGRLKRVKHDGLGKNKDNSVAKTSLIKALR